MGKYEDFKRVLAERIVVFDGATGTMIQRLGLGPGDFGGAAFEMLSDILSLSRPDALEGIHLEYLKAGADCIETNTFGASVLRLQEYDFSKIPPELSTHWPTDLDLTRAGLDEIAREMNIAACRAARRAVESYKKDPDYDGRPLFVVGSVGPSNHVLSPTAADLKKGTWDGVENNFYGQVKALIEGGADLILFETQQDILEVKAGVAGAKRAMAESGIRLPLMVQVTVNEFSRMQIFNTDILAALTTVKDIGIDTFGINCSIGPDLMGPTVEKIARVSQLPISVLPNAGLPESENGRTVYRLTPEDLAAHIERFVKEYGVNIVGGCCGTGPDHIRQIKACVSQIRPQPKRPDTGLFLSGPQNAVRMDGSQDLIRIGERLNVRGSKKVREAVETQGQINYNALEEVVREQIEDLGTPVLDVCMDSAVVDTREVLPLVIQSVTADFKGVLCLDSFDPEALEAAVRVYPGRPLINSISMESHSPGICKADRILEATAFHSPAYIGLAADDNGPAQTREEKVRIAGEMLAACARYGIAPEQLLVDINAFPIGSESSDTMNFALESLAAIPEIKQLAPGVKTTIGVSNLTNGLAKKPYMRMVLTSVFLDEARKQGLDAAIVNPNHYVPVSSIDPGDVELALKIILERDMEAFGALEEIAQLKRGKQSTKKKRYEELSPEHCVCEKIKDGVKQPESGRLTFKDKSYPVGDAIVRDAARALETLDPITLVNDHLMRAMETLGDRFAAGEVSLPHLLKAADLMKQVMGFIEGVMKEEGGAGVQHRATIVMGTVYQDVHSIGKDLTKTLLENYGYRVIDLGVQVPLETFIQTAIKEKADAVGMSSLLVQTANHMLTVARMMAEQGLDLPILIGGAPVNLRHAAHVARAGRTGEALLKKDVFYCPSAMDCINAMEHLFSDRRQPFIEENGARLAEVYQEEARGKAGEEDPRPAPKPVDFIGYTVAPCPPQLMDHTPRISEIPIKRAALQSLNWKAGSALSRQKRGECREDSDRLIDTWISQADANGWVEPRGRLGLFQCNSEGDALIVYDPDHEERELCRIDFTPLSKGDQPGSLARYFLPKSSGKRDVVGFQIATAGQCSAAAVDRFKEEGDSESAHLLYGLANRVAEDFANVLHRELRRTLGLADGAGKRYSPGYPGLGIEQNQAIFELLNAGELGIRLTEAHGFYPLSTTAALVCCHPDAQYA